MSDASLEIKIRTLTEGEGDVVQLGESITSTGDAAVGAGEKAKDGASGIGDLTQQVTDLEQSAASLPDNLGRVADAASGAGDAAQDGAGGINSLAQQATDLQQSAASLPDDLGRVADAASGAGDAAKDGAIGIGSLAQQATELKQSTASLPANLDQISDAASKAGDAAQQGAGGVDALAQGVQTMPARGSASSGWLKALADLFRKVDDSGKAGASGVEAVKAKTEALPKPVATANGWLKSLSELLSGIGASAGAGTEGLAQITGGVEAVSNPAKSLKGEIKELIGLFAALAVAYGLKESADYAARTEVLGTTLGVVAKNAGYSGAQIGDYEGQVKKLGITTQATREALTQMIQAGLELGPTAAGQVAQVSQLARAAQDLAVVTGQSSSATLTSLITNISQLDTVGLRYMGLTVDVEGAQNRFALALGKTSDQLTQQQKIQAVANAALAEAAKLQGAYEASMQNVGKQLTSISRYQEELANDIGTKLLPAYFELVKAATEFLKVADETVKSTDKSGTGAKALADGSRAFFSGLGDLFNSVLAVGSEIVPVFEKVLAIALEFGGEVLHGAAAILQLGDAVDATGRKTSGLGQLINDVVLIPLGILMAGLKDGFTIIGAMLVGLSGAALNFSGVFLQSLGKIVGYFNADFGKAISGAGDSLRATAKDMLDFADDTVAKFGRGETALGKFNARLAESKAATEALARASNYGDIEEQIRRLTEAKRKSTLTDAELKTSADAVAQTITRLGSEVDGATGKMKLSEEQVRKLNQSLLNITRDSAQQFGEAINDMGLKLAKFGSTQYLVPVNKEFEKLAGDVLKLADNATATGVQFQQAFSKGLDSAKTVSDINTISASLKNAAVSGKELGDSAAQVVGQFEKVFAASLKAADTKNEFALLTAEVKALGDKGLISGQIVAKALDDIKEKSTGARAESALLAKQLTELGKSAVDIGKAHLGVVQAEYQVGKARIDVWKAQNQYARDGSDLSREELRLAQLNLQLAEAKAAEARLQYAEAQQNGKVLIAQQEQILAIKRLERDLDNQQLILAKDAADKKLASETAVFEKVKQQTEAQQLLTLKIEESVLQQKLVVDQAQAVVEETKKAASNVASVASASGTASGNLATAASGAGDLNNNLVAAGASAQTLGANLAGATQEQLKLAAAIRSTYDAQLRLDAAQGQNRGVVSFGSQSTKPTTSAPRSSGGYQTIEVSAADSRYYDFTQGKGKLLESDRAFVEAQLQAARDNLEVAQANQAAYSSQGYQSILKLYNDANRALQSLGRAPSAAPTSSSASALSSQLLERVPQRAPSASANLASTAGAVAQAAGSVSKVVQINFKDSTGKNIPATIGAGDESALLELLKRAQGVAN